MFLFAQEYSSDKRSGRDQIGAVACFRQAVVVRRLPKTRSGKVSRGIMGKICDGEHYSIPSTIDDPVILDEIGGSVKVIGYGRKREHNPACYSIHIHNHQN